MFLRDHMQEMIARVPPFTASRRPVKCSTNEGQVTRPLHHEIERNKSLCGTFFVVVLREQQRQLPVRNPSINFEWYLKAIAFAQEELSRVSGTRHCLLMDHSVAREVEVTRDTRAF